MRRLLIVTVTALALSIVSGCFNRPTDAAKKSDEESNFDRMKNIKSSAPKGAKKEKAAAVPNKGESK
jgi:hypothetical protein